IHQRRARPPAAMRVATRAVKCCEQALALGQLVSVVFVLVALLLAELFGGLACDDRVHCNLRRSDVSAGRGFEGAVLAVAGSERAEKNNSQAQARAGLSAAARTHTASRLSQFAVADRSLR